MTSTQERLPPYNAEAEASLLGAILQDPAGGLFRCSEVGIAQDSFYVPAHRIIYKAMVELSEKRGVEGIDILTLSDHIRDCGNIERIGGEVYLHRCHDACHTTAHTQHYVNIVSDDAQRRDIIAKVKSVYENAWDAAQPVTDIVSTFVEGMISLGTSVTRRRTPAQVHADQLALWKRMRKGEVIGVQPMCMAVRKLIYAYMPGDLIILGGGTSEGKTMLALNDAEHASSGGIPVAIASMEMSETQLRSRMACSIASVNSARVSADYGTEEEVARVADAFSVLESYPLFIEDSNRTIDGWLTWAVNMKARYNIGMFIFDYLQLIVRSRDDLRRPKTEYVGDWSKALKGLAKRMHVPVMALSQYSRGERREHDVTPPPPTLAVLRDSGEIEQTADVVMLLSKRDGLPYATFENNMEWPMTLGVDKNRNGPTGRIAMTMRRDVQRYMTEQDFFLSRKPVDEHSTNV